MKRIIGVPAIFILSFMPSYSQSGEAQPMIGQAAPMFTLNDLEGKSYSLEQFRGKYVVIHFATTWCPFCNAEAPHLEQLNKDYNEKDVQVLMIDVKENKSLVESAFKRFNFTFPVLLDEEGTISASYAPADVLPDLARHEVALASNLVIDREGKIRFYSLLNTTHFDARLNHLRATLDELIAREK